MKVLCFVSFQVRFDLFVPENDSSTGSTGSCSSDGRLHQAALTARELVTLRGEAVACDLLDFDELEVERSFGTTPDTRFT